MISWWWFITTFGAFGLGIAIGDMIATNLWLSGISNRPRGKRKVMSWRNSRGYKSRKARENSRKAMGG